jgi:DNA repair protein RecN (Recombination protein N)
MLALKSIFAGRNAVPSMVFDEVDVGVSGRIAQKVGQAMKKLAESHQVLAITHLPQIASAGETHLLVEKRVENKRTRTIVRRLEENEHTNEIARLLSGGRVTDATLQSARELIATFSSR